MHWKTRHQTHDLSRRAMVMGILNVTPDSFSDGGRHDDLQAALKQAKRLIEQGADIIDIGGESTRPGAEPVEVSAEKERVLPVIEAIRAEWDGLISIDTMKPAVAAAALETGADIVNDVSGLRDPAMVEVCAATSCGIVAMHMQGQPRTMQSAPRYDSVVDEVRAYFEERMEVFVKAGIDEQAVAFDPGIGFGKTLAHNLELLHGLERLEVSGRPVLIGLSRKSFIGRILESDLIGDREWPTVALTAWTRESGARIHRVHEVSKNREALRMVEAIKYGVKTT